LQRALLTQVFRVILAVAAGVNRDPNRGCVLSELQKMQRVPQLRDWQAVKRELLKRPQLPYVLIGLAMLVYVIVVWQWL